MNLIPVAKKNTKGVEVLLHKLSEEIRVSLVKICIYYAPAARADDQLSLSKQRSANRRKEYILRNTTVLSVSEKYIDALCYNEMFYSVAY